MLLAAQLPDFTTRKPAETGLYGHRPSFCQQHALRPVWIRSESTAEMPAHTHHSMLHHREALPLQHASDLLSSASGRIKGTEMSNLSPGTGTPTSLASVSAFPKGLETPPSFQKTSVDNQLLTSSRARLQNWLSSQGRVNYRQQESCEIWHIQTSCLPGQEVSKSLFYARNLNHM